MMNFAIGEIPGMVATSPIWRSVRWRLGTARDAPSRLLGTSEQHWARVVMDIETNAPVSRMAVQSHAALEISGAKWADRGFASDRSAQFPEFDIGGEPLGETFDLIIAEQVLEHVLWPYRAVRNLWCMLKPGEWPS
jgi:hypothetical protein